MSKSLGELPPILPINPPRLTCADKWNKLGYRFRWEVRDPITGKRQEFFNKRGALQFARLVRRHGYDLALEKYCEC